MRCLDAVHEPKLRTRIGGNVDRDQVLAKINEGRCLKEGIICRSFGRGILGNCQDIELRYQGEGDASISWHLDYRVQ